MELLSVSWVESLDHSMTLDQTVSKAAWYRYNRQIEGRTIVALPLLIKKIELFPVPMACSVSSSSAVRTLGKCSQSLP